MRRSLLGLGALLAAGLFGGAWHLLQAQAPPQANLNAYLSPESTLYVRWAGHESSKRDFENTAAHRALVESGLAEKLIDQANDQLNRMLEQSGGGPDAKLLADTVRLVADHAFRHGVLAAVDFRLALGEGTFVLPQAAETGLAKEIDGALRKLMQRLGFAIREQKIGKRTIPVAQTQPLTISWWTEGKDLVVVTNMIGPARVVRRIDSGAGGLDQTDRFKRFRADKPFPVVLECWLDAEPLWAMVPRIPRVQNFLKATSLPGVLGAKFAMGYEGKAVRAEYDVLVRSPRQGLLKLLNVSGLRARQLPKLPSDTAALFAFSLDGAHVGDTILETIREFEPTAFNERIRELGEEVGFAVRDEFAATIGPIGLTYLSPMGGPLGLGGVCMAFGVKDKDTLHQTFEIIAEGLIQEDREDIVIERREVRGANLWIDRSPQGVAGMQPTIGLSDRWLVIGFHSPAPVERFFALQQGEGEAWTIPDRLTEMLRKADGSIATITYADPKPFAEILSALAPMITERARKGGVDLRIDITELPSIDRVTGDLFPTAAMTTVDDAGLHGVSESSLPFFGPGLGESAAYVGVGGAVVLPIDLSKRRTARRNQDSNNLKQLGFSLHNYHDLFGSFPRGTAEKGAKLKVEQRLSWIAACLPFLDQDEIYGKLAFDKPWDGPKNKPAADSSIRTFLNPNIRLGAKTNVTLYVGMAGVGPKAPFLKKVTDKGAGVFGYDRVTTLRDITDGSSNTMMVLGVNKDVGPWAQGGRSTIRALTKKPYIDGPDGFGGPKGGVNVVFCDGRVQFVSIDVDPKIMEAMATIKGGEVIPK